VYATGRVWVRWWVGAAGWRDRLLLTFRRTLEAHKELLPVPSGYRVSVCRCCRVEV
jgi:hypothetical protein